MYEHSIKPGIMPHMGKQCVPGLLHSCGRGLDTVICTMCTCTIVVSYMYMYVERTDTTCTCTWSKDPLLIGDKTHASNCFDTNQLIVSLRPSSVAMYKNQTQQSVFLYH